MAQRLYQIVVALIRRDDKILLVQQQGPNDPMASWALPGGVVEEGELLTEALVREVREETGIGVKQVGQLAYVAQLDNPIEGYQSVTFVFEISEWAGTIRPVDPDNLILQTGFLTRSEAISKLQELPWRVMREPIIAYLGGEVGSGRMWVYRHQTDGDDQLIVHLAGNNPAEG
ncbi:MAG: NUDIX hydrolase [Chloroflexi bacterium]|nr:NUDIX hydrolase [Chloroflexota bacterium]